MCSRDVGVVSKLTVKESKLVRSLLVFKDSGLEESLNNIGYVVSRRLRSNGAMFIWVDVEGKPTGNFYTRKYGQAKREGRNYVFPKTK